MVIEYHKTSKMSIDTADFANIFAISGVGAYTGSDPAPPILTVLLTYIERKVFPMKIVILRPPAVITPLLRRMFGIRKEKK